MKKPIGNFIRLRSRLALSMFCVCAFCQTTIAQPASSPSLEEFLRDRIKQLIVARINRGSNPDQKGTPSASSNSTSLVDRTSVADLFGFGLNLAQFAQGVPDSLASSSAAITTTAYALYASAMGSDPLDPAFYNANASLRRFSFTYGYDAPDSGIKSMQLYGLKILVWNDRDASADVNKKRLELITERLTKAAAAFARLEKNVQDYLFQRSGTTDEKAEFINKLMSDWGSMAKHVGEQEIQEIDKFIERELTVFEALDHNVTAAINEIRNAPQASISLTFKKLGQSTKHATIQINFECGLSQVLQLAASAAYQADKLDDGRTSNGGRAGIELQLFAISPDPFFLKEPVTLGFSATAKWADVTKPIYQYQARVDIPAGRGLTLPVVFRWTRAELLGNGDFTTQLGFAFDLAKILSSR